MFGLRSFFEAMARLTAAVNVAAGHFERANERLEQQLSVGEDAGDTQLALESPSNNGRRERRAVRS